MNNPKEIGDFLYRAIDSNSLFVSHNNIVLVGNNSTGKTQSLKKLFDLVKKNNNKTIYYIDPKNRVITDNSIGENTTREGFANIDVLEIIKARTSEENMAQHDVFTNYQAGPITVISELINNIDDYSKLLQATIGMSLALQDKVEQQNELAGIVETGKRDRVLVNNTNQTIETLSSSEASKIRLLMEIWNACNNNCKAVVIDEFDIHFDNDQITQFMDILVKAFPTLRFVFVIHNPETLVNVDNMDALIFNIDGENGIHKIIDTDSIQEVTQIHRLRAKYLGKKKEDAFILEECVAELVEHGILKDEMLEKFQLVKEESLTGKEKVWYSYIKKRLVNAC